jgi:hypothetical protein
MDRISLRGGALAMVLGTVGVRQSARDTGILKLAGSDTALRFATT